MYYYICPIDESILFSNGPDSANDAPPRRSLRKKEDKSYAESPDLFIDDSVLSTLRTDNGKQKSNSMEAIRSKDGSQRAASAIASTAALGEATVAASNDDGGDDGKLLSISSNHRNGGSHLDIDNLRKMSCKTGDVTESVNPATSVSIINGDVEMESENEEDEVSAPVGVMPEPKVQGTSLNVLCTFLNSSFVGFLHPKTPERSLTYPISGFGYPINVLVPLHPLHH